MDDVSTWSRYDLLATEYDKYIRSVLPGYDLMHEIFASFASAASGGDVRFLISGAGAGNELVTLAQRQPGWQIVGVEPSERMCDIARRKARRAGLSNVEIVRSPALDFSSRHHFDAGCISLVLQLFDVPEKRRILAHIRTLLRPNSPLFVFDTCSRRSADTFALELRAMALQNQHNGLPEAEAQSNAATLVNRFHVIPDEDLEQLIAEAGFRRPELIFRTFVTCGWICHQNGSCG